ncbi:MAG: sulfatase [Candidatus Eiseniibacteriota bacterium]
MIPPARRIPSRAARAAAAAVACTVLASCAGEPPPPPVDSAVLVTIDTLRADALGTGGHPRVRTPYLDRFFRRSVQFSAAFSPSATTLASHTSILTGSWPTSHGVLRNLSRVPDELRTLPEILRENGFATAAFVSSAALEPKLNLVQGFDVYDFRPVSSPELEQAWRPAPRTLQRAWSWWAGGGGRRFLWVHVFEPHFPYEPVPQLIELYDPGYTGDTTGDMGTIFDVWAEPDDFTSEQREHLKALYFAEITGLDRILGRFLAELETAPSTIFVVTADHGESLGEHGLHFKHGPYLYPQDVCVPLAVRAPGESPGVVSAMVRTLDIARTLLLRLRVDADLPEESADLLQWRRGGEGLPVFGLASMPWHRFDGPADSQLQRVLRTPRASYVDTPWEKRRELFLRDADPGELQPIAPEGEEAEALRAALDAWVSGSTSPAADLGDPEVKERLRSLGYVE